MGYCYLILQVMCIRYLLYYKRESLPGELYILLSLDNKPASVIPFWDPYTNGYVVMEPDFLFSGSYPGYGRFSVCSKGCTSRSTVFSPSFHPGKARCRLSTDRWFFLYKSDHQIKIFKLSVKNFNYFNFYIFKFNF